MNKVNYLFFLSLASPLLAIPNPQNTMVIPFDHYTEPKYIPSTQIINDNLYKGFEDECLQGCMRYGAVCLQFPWAYRTCFDTVEHPAEFYSIDSLSQNGGRQECMTDLYEKDPRGKESFFHGTLDIKKCPEGQRCLRKYTPNSAKWMEQHDIPGYCIKDSTWEQNHQAFCYGRYAKIDPHSSMLFKAHSTLGRAWKVPANVGFHRKDPFPAGCEGPLSGPPPPSPPFDDTTWSLSQKASDGWTYIAKMESI
jgi:hypothetical protein